MGMLQFIILLLAFGLLGAEQKEPKPLVKQDSSKSIKGKMTITQVLKKYTDKWMDIPGVVGTGEGRSEGKPCILVFVEAQNDTINKKIPKTAEGYKVVIEVTGTIEAFDR